MKIKRALFSGLMWSALDKAVTQGGYFFIMLYLARHLSPEDFGLVGMLTVFSVLADILVNGGFFQALVRQGRGVNDSDCTTVLVVGLLVALLLYLALYLFSGLIVAFYNEPELLLISRVLFLGIVVNSLVVVPKALLTINVDFKSQAKANFTAMIFSALVAIISVLQEMGYWSIVAMLVTRWLGNALFTWYLSKWVPKLVFSFDRLKRLWSFGYKLVIAGLISTLGNNIYSLVIGRGYGAIQTGYFAQSKSFTELLAGNVAQIIQGVTFPVLANKSDDYALLQSLYEKTIRATMFVTFPIMIGFASVSEEFVLVFLGDKWLPIVPLVMYMSLSRLLIPVSALNINGLNILGKSGLYLLTDILKLPATFLVLYFTFPYGLEAIVKGQILVAAISYVINSYYPSKNFRYKTVNQILDMLPVLIICFFMWFVTDMISIQSDFWRLVSKVVAGILLYSLLSYLLNRKMFDELAFFLKRG